MMNREWRVSFSSSSFCFFFVWTLISTGPSAIFLYLFTDEIFGFGFYFMTTIISRIAKYLEPMLRTKQAFYIFIPSAKARSWIYNWINVVDCDVAFTEIALTNRAFIPAATNSIILQTFGSARISVAKSTEPCK